MKSRWQAAVSDGVIRVVLVIIAASIYFTDAALQSPTGKIDWSGAMRAYSRKEGFSEGLLAGVLVLLMVITLLIALFLSVMMTPSRRRWQGLGWMSWRFFMSVTLAFITSNLLMVVIKNYTIEPRPSYLAMCYGTNSPELWGVDVPWFPLDTKCAAAECEEYKKPESMNVWEPFTPPYGSVPDCEKIQTARGDLLEWPINIHEINDFMKSFPSGHATNASCVGVWTIMHVSASLARKRYLRQWGVAVATCMSIPYLMICLSRYNEGKHTGWDITAGVLLGGVMAYVSYVIYYPADTQFTKQQFAYGRHGLLPALVEQSSSGSESVGGAEQQQQHLEEGYLTNG